MSISSNECLCFDAETAMQRGEPLGTQAEIVGRREGVTIRRCIGCNATCAFLDTTDGPPQCKQPDDIAGLRAACGLPS